MELKAWQVFRTAEEIEAMHFEEELYEHSRADGDQVWSIYCREVMEFVNLCPYVEYDGHTVIGPDRVKSFFKVDLENGELEYTHDDSAKTFLKARSKSGHTYFFSKGTSNENE